MQHKVLIWVLVSVIWVVYAIWEFQIQTWLKYGALETIRLDLILLPPLLAVTASILYISNKTD